MSAIDEIAAERRRQIEAEGWLPEHDDKHDRGELAMAAGCYAHFAGADERLREYMHDQGNRPPLSWPWSAGWWKPKSRRHDLIRAAALIVAEIERMDRKEKP